MLNYVALSFLSVVVFLNASDECTILCKKKSVAHIGLKIEDNGSSNSGSIVIKFAPKVSEQLSDKQSYFIPFAEHKDLVSWSKHPYEFGALERSLDRISIADNGISLALSPVSISRIQSLQKKGCAVALNAPLTELEVLKEISEVSIAQPSESELQHQKSESELPSYSPIYAIRRFLSQDNG